jgi:hypothetical protein
MRATSPATWPAHAAFKLRDRFGNPNIPRLNFFARDYPTNPLIAGQGSNIVPHGLRCFIASNSLAQITRELMRHNAIILS